MLGHIAFHYHAFSSIYVCKSTRSQLLLGLRDHLNSPSTFKQIFLFSHSKVLLNMGSLDFDPNPLFVRSEGV